MEWTRFNTHGESPNRAFEVMCNILFEGWCKSEYKNRLKYFSFVNGSGGDGGVEAYATLDSGEVIGVQSKWFPESFIVTTDGDDETVLFATKRYDRKFIKENKILNNMPVPRRLHQEDFAQALCIAAANKYEKNNEGYLKKLFDVIRAHSADPMTDSLKLWDICVFNYLIGNTDNHIKNLSLLYSEDLKSVRLAPAYDIVSTMIYQSSTENMALAINGICNINEITRTSFEKTASQVGIGPKMAMKRFDVIVEGFETAINRAKEELKSQGFDQVEQICDMIMAKGGIRKELMRLKA